MASERWFKSLPFGATALALCLQLFSAVAQAQLMAEPLPGDPHLVVFPYDENNSYRLFVKPRAVTNIVLEPDERVSILALGDTSSFQSVQKNHHIFLKPLFPNRTTWGTLVTNKRSYQFQIIATDDGAKWYQRVSFVHSDLVALREQAEDRAVFDAVAGAPGGPVAPPANGGLPLPPPASEPPAPTARSADLHFGYKMEGKADFRPTHVYDDGKVTTLRFPENADLPAVFRIVKGEVELLDYTQHPTATNVIVIPRILDSMLLKLGKEEVRIVNTSRVRTNWFGRVDTGE